MEQELPTLIKKIYGGSGDGLFAAEENEVWKQAEQRLCRALRDFNRQVSTGYQSELFALDALQGLRMIDLTGETFDVVLMNPPFGALPNLTKAQLGKAYPNSKNDLLAIFVERGLTLLRHSGRLGAITARTCFFLSSYQKWRKRSVLGIGKPEVMVDLGHGVMDDAMAVSYTHLTLPTTPYV